MAEETAKDPNEVSQEEIQNMHKPNGEADEPEKLIFVFPSRIAEVDFECMGITFKLTQLLTTVRDYCEGLGSMRSGAVNHGKINTEAVRFCIVGWEGMKDEKDREVEPKYETVNIEGKQRKRIIRDQIDKFPTHLMLALIYKITEISTLPQKEQDRLGFTTASEK